jgi:hypothetical protein
MAVGLVGECFRIAGTRFCAQKSSGAAAPIMDEAQETGIPHLLSGIAPHSLHGI